MSNKQLIQSSGGSMTAGSQAPADDLLRRGVRRLVFFAIAVGLVGVAYVALSAFKQPNVGPRAGYTRPVWPMAALAIGSLAMILVARLRSLLPSRRLDIALVYLVFVCAIAAFDRHALPYASSDVVRGFSPAALALVFFSVLVPVNPRRMLITALVAMLLDPLMLYLTVLGGNPPPTWNVALWFFLPNIFAVLVSVGASTVVFELGKSLTEARQLGAYRLVELLGTGGMGEVWRAEHRNLARSAAIKLVKPEVLGTPSSTQSSSALLRFEREAKATALLHSPHTIQVFDYGTSDDGTFYYVMELLEGMDLDRVLGRDGALPISRAVFILEQVCHSLRDAHGSGLVHRDIKPANVYLCRMGSEVDYVKVLDFGLVKDLHSSASEPDLTISGAIAGTPTYMAPEIVNGDAVTPRTDIYALGCLAYRMLAGRDVFLEKGLMAMLMAQVNTLPAPLNAVAPQEVPEELAEIVMHCLAKNPQSRPRSAEEIMKRLQATGLSEEWTQERAQAWWESSAAFLRAPAEEDVASAQTVLVGKGNPAGEPSESGASPPSQG